MVREIISLSRCFSGVCDSEDGCSSVTDGSAVVFGVVDAGFCGVCCEFVVDGVFAIT
jgi:hypothetical protein